MPQDKCETDLSGAAAVGCDTALRFRGRKRRQRHQPTVIVPRRSYGKERRHFPTRLLEINHEPIGYRWFINGMAEGRAIDWQEQSALGSADAHERRQHVQ